MVNKTARQTVIITGGNSGLGYACASTLLMSSQPYHVILACRNPERAEEAVHLLRKSVMAEASVEAMVLDLASFASVRAFSAKLKERLEAKEIPPLYGLVCNAGVQGKKVFTVDGFESTFAVNILGHYLLIDLLLPSFMKPARIAIVASGVHDPAQMEGLPAGATVPAPAWNSTFALAKGELGPSATNDDENADRGRRYSTSKLASIYLTYGLAQQLPEGITVNAFDPGMMPGTGLAREYTGLIRFMWDLVMPRVLPLMRRFITQNIHSPKESGIALARLITDPALNGISGKYFEGLKEIRSSIESYDEERAMELLHSSAVLTAIEAPAL